MFSLRKFFAASALVSSGIAGAAADIAPSTATGADPQVFVADLVARMTLEEKVGQMIQADIASISPAELRQYPLGSILAGGNAAPANDVHSGPQAWLALVDAYHRVALEHADRPHPPIPLLFGIDAVHGHAKVVGATIFPHNVGLGATHDPELIRRIGQATAEEVAATGIDWTFAPTVAVVRDVRWGRSYESYAEDPVLVADYAASMVIGLQGRRDTPEFMTDGHTLSSVKHFVGDGGTAAGRDQGETNVPEAQLLAVHGAAYPAAIGAGAMIVMASYNSWNGEKMHASQHLLTDVLKGRLGFDGFVVGDWNAHEQIPGCTKYDCPRAILAGVDMLMAPDSWRLLYDNTIAEVRAGQIPLSRVDDAVRRILRVKLVAGLFGRTTPPQASSAEFSRLGSAEHRALARDAVRRSLVLLKNERSTLPLEAHARILVAGSAADSIGMQTGGWTVDWQGDHNRNSDFPGATSIYAGVRAAVTAAGGTVALSEDGRFSRKPDAAIVVFGEAPYAEFEGDRENLAYSLQAGHDLRLLRRLHAAGVPTVAVFLSGRPMWVNPEINASDAFVAAWLPGSEGDGVADVLFRATHGRPDYDFTGRLAFSWPETGMPVTFDASGTVAGALFARGYGLDYRHSAAVPRLPEDPRVPPDFRPAPGNLVRAGHVVAPWSIFVADDVAEVHLTTARQDSPQRMVTAEVTPAGFAAAWTGVGRGVFRISGRARDLRPQAGVGSLLTMRYRVDLAPAADQRVDLGVHCTSPACAAGGGPHIDVSGALRVAPVGQWRTMSVPLSCLDSTGQQLAAVDAPFSIATSGHLALTFAAVSLESGRAGVVHACP